MHFSFKQPILYSLYPPYIKPYIIYLFNVKTQTQLKLLKLLLFENNEKIQ